MITNEVVRSTAGVDHADAATSSAAAELEPASAIHDVGHVHPVAFWRVDALQPNVHNASLFPDSLSAKQIALLARDFEKHGQIVPIEITPGGKIVNGERRWQAARSLGWQSVRVIVLEELSDEQILDRVLDACVSARQMTLREQTNIYCALVTSLTKEMGVPQGRPAGKRSPNGDTFVRATKIKKIAAARARFSSAKLAERAEAVFTRADQGVQDRVCSGELTISAAYELLPKRSKKCTGPAEPNPEVEIDSRDADPELGTVLDNPFEALSESGARTSVDDGGGPRPAETRAKVEIGAGEAEPHGNVLDNPFEALSESGARTSVDDGGGPRPAETRAKVEIGAGEAEPHGNVLDNPFEALAASSSRRPSEDATGAAAEPDATGDEAAEEVQSGNEQQPEQAATGRQALEPIDGVGDEAPVRGGAAFRAESKKGPGPKRKPAKQRAAEEPVDEALGTVYRHVTLLVERDRSFGRAFAIRVMMRLKELINAPA